MTMPCIDVHCHLLTGGNFFHDLYALLTDGKQAPVELDPGASEEALAAAPWPVKLLGRAQDWLQIPFVTAEQLYEDEKDGCEASVFGSRDLAIVPLMLDIRYLLHLPDEPHDAQTDSLSPQDRHNNLEAALDTLKQHMKAASDGPPGQAARALHDRFVPVLRKHEDDLQRLFKGVLQSSFDQHVVELKQLAAAHPNMVFPFLAVDPRRPGIRDLVTQVVRAEGPFCGVKIYPSTGYYPDNPVLMDIYDYCQANNLPVTTHCQHEGFTVRLDADEFTRPHGWEPVLEQYNNLRLNFAHFGGLVPAQHYPAEVDDIPNWTAKIIELMATYPNVHADVAAWDDSDPDDTFPNWRPVAQLVKDLQQIDLGQGRTVADRLMFGTDFTISTLTHITLDGSIRKYFDCYSPDMGAAFLHDNANRFLHGSG